MLSTKANIYFRNFWNVWKNMKKMSTGLTAIVKGDNDNTINLTLIKDFIQKLSSAEEATKNKFEEAQSANVFNEI